MHERSQHRHVRPCAFKSATNQNGDDARQTPELRGFWSSLTFNEQELADYLGISRKTLQKWRSLGLGPNYLKLGAKVVYRIEDVNAYIQRSLRIQRP